MERRRELPMTAPLLAGCDQAKERTEKALLSLQGANPGLAASYREVEGGEGSDHPLVEGDLPRLATSHARMGGNPADRSSSSSQEHSAPARAEGRAHSETRRGVGAGAAARITDDGTSVSEGQPGLAAATISAGTASSGQNRSYDHAGVRADAGAAGLEAAVSRRRKRTTTSGGALSLADSQVRADTATKPSIVALHREPSAANSSSRDGGGGGGRGGLNSSRSSSSSRTGTVPVLATLGVGMPSRPDSPGLTGSSVALGSDVAHIANKAGGVMFVRGLLSHCFSRPR